MTEDIGKRFTDQELFISIKITVSARKNCCVVVMD